MNIKDQKSKKQINNIQIEPKGFIKIRNYILEKSLQQIFNKDKSRNLTLNNLLIHSFKRKLYQSITPRFIAVIMNPYPYNHSFTNFQISQRDKTKSYLQPTNQNNFYNSIGNTNGSNSNFVVGQPTTPYHQSEKYKNFYNQFQDYRHSSVSQIQKTYAQSTVNDKSIQKNRSNLFFQDKFPSTSPVAFNQINRINSQQSIQRKRLYTNPGNQINLWRKQNMNQLPQNVSTYNSIISNGNFKQINKQTLINRNNSNVNATDSQQINPKTDLFKFVNQKFAASRVQSTYNSRQKKNNLNNKSQYLEKANKKISLKKDLVANSPKYKQMELKSSSFITKNQELQNQRHKATSFFQPLFNKKLNQQEIISQTNPRSQNQQMQRFSSSSSSQIIVDNKNNNEMNFKKTSNVYEVITDLGSASTISKNEMVSPNNSARGTNYIGNIKKNNSLTSANSAVQMIDPQIYADMKISRIQESTTNLQQKLQKVLKSIQVLSHQNKQNQSSILEINSYIAKQQQEGTSSHDIKRIKKQLKIMKTNFQTAFTSMTDQINRKLIKQENIMKNLSQQIRLVSQQNKSINDILVQKFQKVDILQKSVNSFMKQNEQRMQNLILNESFNSSKRSKNHSFEYGLDLKNMSNDENNMNVKPQVIQNINKKIQIIERQIKKIKIFHMQQQQSFNVRLNQLKSQIKAVGSQQKPIKQGRLKQMMQQINQNMIQIKLSNMSQKIAERQQKKLTLIKQEIQIFKIKIDELYKICHQELYQFRLTKLQPKTSINAYNNFASTNNQVKSIQYEQKLSQINNKQRSFMITLAQYQQRLFNLEERQLNIQKNVEDQKLKQLKLTGDVRESQNLIKDINNIYIKDIKKELSLLNISNQKLQNQYKKANNQLSLHTNLLTNIQQKMKELDRINCIQTQNIQSINNQFQRVINRQIIPKFGQIHQINFQTNQKINNLQFQITSLKKNQNLFNSSKNYSNEFNKQKLQLSKQIEKKVQTYFQIHLQKFIKNNIKVVSSRQLQKNQTLYKIGLFKNYTQSQKKNKIGYEYINNQQEIIKKQDVYLVDQNGYLMDWEGAYLMQINQLGIKSKIKLTQQEIYFMEVNGVDVKHKN